MIKKDNNNTFYSTMINLMLESIKYVLKNPGFSVRIFYLLDNNIVSVIIGQDYEFKKLKINKDSISISLANNYGKFIKYNIFYKDVFGFYSEIMYMLYIDHQCSYINNEENNSSKTKLTSIFNEQIKHDMENICNKNNFIKITFFENFPGLEIPKHLKSGEKLLVLILEDEDWIGAPLENGLEIYLLDTNSKLFIPYNSIVTYFNYFNELFLNRNVKIIEEDFTSNKKYFEENNMIYVDFKKFLEDEIQEDYIMNYFISTLSFNKNKKIDNDNNLIIGNFEPKNNK